MSVTLSDPPAPPAGGPFVYAYPHPAVATDIAIFTLARVEGAKGGAGSGEAGEGAEEGEAGAAGALKLLLIERGEAPFKGAWALPGGFLRPDEDLDACARRELFEETGVEVGPAGPGGGGRGEGGGGALIPFGAFSAPDRDPRERVISFAYLALLPGERLTVTAGSDAAGAAWHALDALPPLAFDHAAIVAAALRELRARAGAFEILLALMGERFTLGALQGAYEAVTGARADKRNFRKAAAESGLIVETDDWLRGAHRPARLWRRREA